MSTQVTTEAGHGSSQVHDDLRLIIEQFCAAAEKHPLSPPTKVVSARIRGLVRLNLRIYAVDEKWRFVIVAQENILCLLQPGGYVDVDIDTLDTDLAASLAGSIGLIVAILQRL